MPPKIVIRTFIPLLALLSSPACDHKPDGRTFNAPYEGEYLSQIAFPIGGMGAGMFCIEGNGTISHMSIHHVPELFNEPLMFAALHVKGQENGSKVIEGNVPEWKKYGRQGATLGISNPAWGFPRFDRARFTARFLLRTSSSRMTICRWMRKSQPGVLSFLPMKMIRDCLPEHLNTALPTVRPKRWKLYFRTTVIISPIATTRHRGRSNRSGTDSSLHSAPETNRVMNIVNLRSLPTIRRP